MIVSRSGRLVCEVVFVLAASVSGIGAQKPEAPFVPAPAVVSTPNEQARFLSGLRVPAGSVLAPLQATREYYDHGSTYANTWRRFDEKYFSKMRAWSAAELAPRIGTPRALFYLFGGPDFINAYALFPDAPIYVLGGLEPVGSMVPPEQLDLPRVLAGLENLRKSTSVTLQFSHFITKDMKVELEQTDFQGVLPILLSFIALGGGEILAVQTFSPGGNLPGVAIQFRKNPAAVPQVLYYVRADVSDGALKANPALLSWMQQLGPGVSYLKAASYLMHEPYFSRVRGFLLENSSAILQDDSGIPLRYFLTGNWRLQFFGAYTGPLELFQKYTQPDLADAFRSAPVFDLPFGTGYKWQPGQSNLMLAIKQATAPVAEPVQRLPTPPMVPGSGF